MRIVCFAGSLLAAFGNLTLLPRFLYQSLQGGGGEEGLGA
jgi:hypothetical protein